VKASANIASRGAHKRASGPGRPRSELADRAILRAALKVFIERGIEGATIEQIADAARVARTTLYRRWSSKEALIAQAIAAARGAAESQTLNRVKLSKSPEPLIDALAATFTSPDYKKLAARLIGSVPNNPELMAVYWRDYLLPRRRMVRGLLEGVVRAKREPEIILDLISGAVIHHLFVRPGERTRAEMRSYLARVLDELGLGRRAEQRRSEIREV
jgi:AcrR family transcriptional regulator